LYRKSLEGKEREEYEKKRRLKIALKDGKRLDGDLVQQQDFLTENIMYDDGKTGELNIDDEYARAGIRDPKIIITTSRDPSSRLKIFAKELKLVFPNAQRFNRGNYIIKEVVETCRAKEVTDLIIVHETRGEPDGLIISHLPYGPTAKFALMNVVMRHDIDEKQPMSLAYPHLIFHRFDSGLGERVQNILKYLFPVPKEESKRVITFANFNDFISFRHHTYVKYGKVVNLAEVGPRFEMRLYQIKLGTLEMTEAENEWVLRPYLSNASRKEYLAM